MKVVRKDHLVNLLCQRGCIITGVGTDAVSDAGGYISCPCGRISFAPRSSGLVDPGAVYDRLKFAVDLRHLFKGNAGDLKPLPGSEIYGSVAVPLCDFLNFPEILRLQQSSRHAYSGRSDTPHLRHAKRVLF